MGMPSGIGIIDTMIGFPHRDMKECTPSSPEQTKDKESKEDFKFPVGVHVQERAGEGTDGHRDPIAITLQQMDLWGVERGLIGVGDERRHRRRR